MVASSILFYGRSSSKPLAFSFPKRAGVCLSLSVDCKLGFSVGYGRSSVALVACASHRTHWKALPLWYPALCHPRVLRLALSRYSASNHMPSCLSHGCPLFAEHQEPGTAVAFPPGTARKLHLCPGRPTAQDERIIHSLQPIQSSASRLTLPTEVPINANYNGDFSDMGTYSYRPSNSHHILMTVSHYQYWRSLN